MTLLGTVTLVAGLFFMAQPSHSVTQEAELAPQRYQALEKVDVEALDRLLSDNAEIVLNDLDIIQTKSEFLESMDDWAEAIKGGMIRTKTESVETGKITLSICYTFSSNQLLTEEVLIIDGGQIINNAQTEISDDCSDRGL